MVKKYYCLVLFILIAFSLHAQNNWYKLRLGDSVVVSFPQIPGKGAGISYGCKDSSGVVFAASVSDIANAINFTKTAFDSIVVEQDFANDFLEGFKPSMPDYIFGPVSISNLTGKVSYQFQGRNEQKKTNIYFIAIFIDGKAYSFTCILPDGRSIRDKNLFFKGIQTGR